MAFRDEVEALLARYLAASARRDAAGAAAVFTEDAVYLAAGSAPMRGRAAIAADFAAMFESGVADTSATIVSAEGEGDLGYAIQSVATGAGTAFSLLVYRRDGQGSWGICAEAFVGK